MVLTKTRCMSCLLIFAPTGGRACRRFPVLGHHGYGAMEETWVLAETPGFAFAGFLVFRFIPLRLVGSILLPFFPLSGWFPLHFVATFFSLSSRPVLTDNVQYQTSQRDHAHVWRHDEAGVEGWTVLGHVGSLWGRDRSSPGHDQGEGRFLNRHLLS
ncbi:hypothetical protein B0T11DRAFT_101326 [Plectosphaerella cucumerina]|uniref:Uncharacterized protein n=1 Tax=Plectosphaerella cucumerina TaxID=40658 RepID=A0A8K0T8G3_9PEZI|nr:hypothetical protein B0T11DRAFT_101326 [Plectosphaerella cucumerina]